MSVHSPQRRFAASDRARARTVRVLPPLALLIATALPLEAQTVLVREAEFRPRELRVSAIQLDRPETLRIHAVGAEPGGLQRFARARNAIVRLVREVFDHDVEGSDERNGWPADAWIVDAQTRAVVWQLGAAETEQARNGLREFDGEVQLPAGTYEVYYSVFAEGWHDSDLDLRFDRGAADELLLLIEGRGRRIAASELRQRRADFRAAAIASLTGGRGDAVQKAGFILDRATPVEVYALGEASAGEQFDYGWIMDADTRENVWELDYAHSRHAGGAWRNRVARETLTLPAGRYVAFYVTDASHAPDDWNGAPPMDPEFWGLTLRVTDAAARAAVRSFAYEPAPADQAIVALTAVRDSELRARGFTLTQPMGMRIFALGEGEEDGMFDYGWIANAHTRERVWSMEYAATEHAGGASKNRLYDGVIRLEPGSYIVSYVTDDSHATGEWNGRPPIDREYWGITVLPATGAPDPAIVRPYDPREDPAILAQHIGVRDGQTSRRRFTLDADAEVRVYALGEGAANQMYDRAWIEDAAGGIVWEMRYDETSHAGGADKNRVFNDVISLPAGDYELLYRTDDSHAFGSWNADPPHDFASWGVTLFRTDLR
jgi:hypothetical protein